MKISILQYLSETEDDGKLYGALVSAGFRVCRIGNLSRLHTILESRFFDAILIHRHFLTMHCMSADRHLKDANAPLAIIDWEISVNGGVSFEVHRRDREEKLSPELVAVTEFLSGIGKGRNDELMDGKPSPSNAEGPAATMPVTLTISGLSFHKKLGQVLEVISESGEKGADIQAITDRIWGTTARNRKKDIQIYVSKLRSTLSGQGGKRYSIKYENKRYFLTGAKS